MSGKPPTVDTITAALKQAREAQHTAAERMEAVDRLCTGSQANLDGMKVRLDRPGSGPLTDIIVVVSDNNVATPFSLKRARALYGWLGRHVIGQEQSGASPPAAGDVRTER